MARITGVIEGFYGTPWTWAERTEVARAVADAGGNTYVYAPKDDPLHRARWREPYPDDWLVALAELVRVAGVRVGVAISPGLSIDATAVADHDALSRKVGQFVDVGVDLVVLALDDVPFAPEQGALHGRLTATLRDRVDASVEVAMVPNHYTGCRDVPYLAGLRSTLPDDVPVGWTGRHVVNDSITTDDAARWIDVMGGRRPLLWDNVPVNDLVMSDRLHLGPLRGRDPGLTELLGGYLANVGVQAAASVPTLRSAMAWAEGGDAVAEWERAVGAARPLAWAVDGVELGRRIDAAEADGSWDDVEDLLDQVERCDDGGLGDAVAPWVAAARAEASVGRSAVRLLRGHGAAASRSLELMALGVTWPPVRRHEVSVFGPRHSFRPAFGQSDEGDWLAEVGSIQADENQIDRLVRLALEAEALR